MSGQNHCGWMKTLFISLYGTIKLKLNVIIFQPQRFGKVLLAIKICWLFVKFTLEINRPIYVYCHKLNI